MLSIRTSRVAARGWCFAILLLLSLFCNPAGALETDSSKDTEIWLVTYGPGEIYWERFGHNAIWLREPGQEAEESVPGIMLRPNLVALEGVPEAGFIARLWDSAMLFIYQLLGLSTS